MKVVDRGWLQLWDGDISSLKLVWLVATDYQISHISSIKEHAVNVTLQFYCVWFQNHSGAGMLEVFVRDDHCRSLCLKDEVSNIGGEISSCR